MNSRIYSAGAFLELITSNNSKMLDEVTSQLSNGAKTFLVTRFQADLDDAQEVVQGALLRIFERITDGKMQDIDNVFAYLLTVVRNDYVRYIQQQRKFRSLPEDDMNEHVSTPFLIKEIYVDREFYMKECLKELTDSHSKFIKQVFDNIEQTDYETADLIGLSYSAFRTKKSRILHILSKCIARKKREV